MKLVFLIHSLAAGGAERVTANLANHWAKKGREVTIITITGSELDYYALHPSISRIALGLDSDSRGPLSAILSNFNRALQVRRIVKRARPDVAIAMMTQANILLAMSTFGLSKVVTVGSERTHPPQLPLGMAWERLRKYWYGRLSAIVSLTSETREWLGANTAGKHIVIIPNPVPWPFPRQAPLITPDKTPDSPRKLLLAVGRLSEEKGYRTLIMCFAKLAVQHADWDLAILGEGKQRSELEQLVESLAMSSRIRLHGQTGNVGDWYASADLYVLSSRFEGFPNTLAEAMAHGLPAVSFDCDTGPRDIIRHDIDGLLVKTGDADALVQSLERLMSDANLRRKYAAKAKDARERFSQDVTIQRWERLFDELQSR